MHVGTCICKGRVRVGMGYILSREKWDRTISAVDILFYKDRLRPEDQNSNNYKEGWKIGLTYQFDFSVLSTNRVLQPKKRHLTFFPTTRLSIAHTGPASN